MINRHGALVHILWAQSDLGLAGIGTVFVEIGIDCKGLDPVLIPCNSNERRVCIKFIL